MYVLLVQSVEDYHLIYTVDELRLEYMSDFLHHAFFHLLVGLLVGCLGSESERLGRDDTVCSRV